MPTAGIGGSLGKQRLNYVDDPRKPVITVLMLAWPVFLEQILTTLVSYADTAMVGSLGAYATAAVSISNSVVMLLNGLIMALGVGITALISRSIGAGDASMTRKLVRHTILILLFIGLPMGIVLACLSRAIPVFMGAEPDILEYATKYNLIVSVGRPFQIASMLFFSVFRGCGDTRTPLRINILVNIINVVGNYFLIFETHTVRLLGWKLTVFGAGMGTSGAALATAVSMVFGGIAAVALVFRGNTPMRIHFRDSFRPDLLLLRQILRISFPAMLERLCMSTAQVVIAASIASMGTVAVAANTVYVTVESIAFMPGFAFATAATTLVGQALGAKRPDLAQRLAHTCVLTSFVAMTLAGTGLFFLGPQVARFFTPDAAVIALASQCLQIVAFLQPGQTGAMVFAGALRGAGDTLWPMIIIAAGTWVIRAFAGGIVCIRILGLGLPAAVTCMAVESYVRCLLMYLRFRTGKWKTAIREVHPASGDEEASGETAS